jgi:hypothetical protein
MLQGFRAWAAATPARRLRAGGAVLSVVITVTAVGVTPVGAAVAAVGRVQAPLGTGVTIGGSSYELAAQLSTGNKINQLVTQGTSDPYAGTLELSMMPGTSPAVALLPDGNYEVAAQASTGCLWTRGTEEMHGCWNFGMMAGTSPAITALADGGYEVAAQAKTGDLWTLGTAGIKNWSLAMDPASSPGITTLTNGNVEIAFEANTDYVWFAGSRIFNSNFTAGVGATPSIARLADGNFVTAWRYIDGNGNPNVMLFDPNPNQPLDLFDGPIDSHSNPAISTQP